MNTREYSIWPSMQKYTLIEISGQWIDVKGDAKTEIEKVDQTNVPIEHDDHEQIIKELKQRITTLEEELANEKNKVIELTNSILKEEIKSDIK